MREKQPIIILGMHRSATSLIAQGLISQKVHMGERLMEGDRGNPQGHFENMDFVELNDRILKKAGGSWDNPPPESDIISVKKEFSDEIESLLNKSVRRKWGWKDPRTVLTIRLFMPYLHDPFFICCFRKPARVAESLFKRDNMSVKKGLMLAKLYNNRLNNFMSYY